MKCKVDTESSIFICPTCHKWTRSKVIDTRMNLNSTCFNRTRQCPECGTTWNTIEILYSEYEDLSKDLKDTRGLLVRQIDISDKAADTIADLKEETNKLIKELEANEPARSKDTETRRPRYTKR